MQQRLEPARVPLALLTPTASFVAVVRRRTALFLADAAFLSSTAGFPCFYGCLVFAEGRREPYEDERGLRVASLSPETPDILVIHGHPRYLAMRNLEGAT